MAFATNLRRARVGINVTLNEVKSWGVCIVIFKVCAKDWCFHTLIWYFLKCKNMLTSSNFALGMSRRLQHGPIGEWP